MELIGRIRRPITQIISLLMDSTIDHNTIPWNFAAGDNNIYGDGFYFKVLLKENSSHKPAGYIVQVVLFTNNTSDWVNNAKQWMIEQYPQIIIV